ncbi:MAG: hypothetical protein KGL10_07120 [Alphaproteobacteria bacterium]|nr:hypothetical protein [Alphaproteobacteria bacterium]
MNDDELDIDMGDFDDQPAPADAAPSTSESGAVPPRGNPAILKLAILFVVVAAGGGVYLALSGHGGHHRVAERPARAAQQHAALPAEKTTAAAHPAPGASLPVVNDQPPSAALLSPAPVAASGSMPAPALAAPAMPAMAMAPSPAPISSAPPSPFSIPSPEPQQPQTAAAPGNPVAAVPAGQVSMQTPTMGAPVMDKPQVKGDKTMPAIVVPSVNKIDISAQNGTQDAKQASAAVSDNTSVAGMPEDSDNAAMDSSGAENADMPVVAKPAQASAGSADDSAEVRALKKKIALLERTIAQLQQAPVVAEGTGSKNPAPPVRHGKKNVVRHHRYYKVRHDKAVRASSWVLKAAKPGVAWVARKGSEVLHKVKPGDSLTGIGQVEFIVHDSFGAWVIVGTKGRISQ